MTQPRSSGKDGARPNDYWMRAVSFAGLHRILKAVADSPNGLTAGAINGLVRDNDISLTRRSSAPAPTTLYHYRNTLLRLCAIKRDGRMLRANEDDPYVSQLLRQPTPENGVQSISDAARDPFAALVLNNEQCKSLFFDVFMPLETSSYSVSDFRNSGLPVKWTREHPALSREVLFLNNTTGRTIRFSSPAGESAVLYGVRYWARDELQLIDEYGKRSDGGTIMFPVSQAGACSTTLDPTVLQTVRILLSLRTPGEWTLFSVADLIARCCESRRRPIRVLFDAIDWLRREWPGHIAMIPTSRALATLTATSPQRDALELRRYYKASNGPYISHIRIHRDITAGPMELPNHDPHHPSQTRA